MNDSLISIILLLLFPYSVSAQDSCPDDLHPHAIDLGLPSGTKWACCDVGADSPNDFGELYAWGETSSKQNFSVSKYALFKKNPRSVFDDEGDFVYVGNNIKGTYYDAATQEWGYDWSMPTEYQVRELKENCKFTGNYNQRYFTGPNGNRIRFNYTSVENNPAEWWTSELGSNKESAICFSIFMQYFVESSGRECGKLIRPVTTSFDKNVNSVPRQEKMQAKDEQTFRSSCEKNTISAYQQYLGNFPNGRFRNEVQERINEIRLWEDTKRINTKAAYQKYITGSRYKIYQKEATEAINRFESDEEWNRIKESDNWTIFEQFVRKYPNSVYVSEAKYHINLLKGEQYYKPGIDFQASENHALSLLTEANSYRRLTGKPAEHLEDLLGRLEHHQMMNSKNETAVLNYLNGLSQGNVYYIPTSNHLAELKADKLSSSYQIRNDYKEAMSYAKNNQTEQYVKNCYKKIKSKRKKDWLKEHVQMGYDMNLEMSLVPKSDDEKDELLDCVQFGFGLLGRVGNYADLFNVSIGVRYWFVSSPKVVDDEYENEKNKDKWKFKGYLSFPVNVRCNLIRTENSGSFYIGGGAEYGLCMSKKLETSHFEKNYFSLSPQIGWTNENVDVSIYYKSYLHGPFKKEWVDNFKRLDRKNIIGINVGYYF